ncbi:MAG TPA: FAD/NAD(P)-binding protein [Desulfuromonadales bacterium]|nr:FAD/NAD(P)-binding protein [Desulfuromonadales bacterium]
MTVDFMPLSAKIETIDRTVEDNHVFTFRLGRPLPVAPGQFIEVSLAGLGAFPVTACGMVSDTAIPSCIRRAGRVTEGLYQLRVGDTVGVRGPFGNGFPLEHFWGKDALLIAGGLGMAPLRGLLHALLERRDEAGEIVLLYGSREPETLLFRDELESFERQGLIRLDFTVDFVSEVPWTPGSFVCKVGMVNELLQGLRIDPTRTVAAVCGPPALYGCVLEELASLGIPPERIFATLERRMKCGVGECCHCVTGGTFICRQGPVFSLAELRNIEGAI